jgi:hypothetical protein
MRAIKRQGKYERDICGASEYEFLQLDVELFFAHLISTLDGGRGLELHQFLW